MLAALLTARLFPLVLLLSFPCLTRAERLPLKTYTVADGLAHNEINKIVRDSRGFLWFCTVEGTMAPPGRRFMTARRLCCLATGHVHHRDAGFKTVPARRVYDLS